MAHPTHRILLVDDNRLLREMLQAPLEAAGYETLGVATGRGATELMALERPDLVLLDIVLPDAMGYEVARELRAASVGRHVPIVAVTGFLSRVEAGDIAAARFDEVLTKPVESARLLDVVRHLLSRAGGPDAPGRGRRVLVADDDPGRLKLAAIRLAQAGFQVRSARDGQDALEAARRDPPDAILCEVLVPGLDGFKLCQAVRADPALAGVPVVLASGGAVDAADRRLAARTGASALVSTALGLDDAVAALDRSIAGGPPAPLAEVPAEVEPEYVRTVLRQLGRQTELVRRLAQRCSTQAAMLSAVSSLSEAWATAEELEGALGQALGEILDIGGISHGVLYRVIPLGIRRVAASGFDEPALGKVDGFVRAGALDRIVDPDGPPVLAFSAATAPGLPPGLSAVLVPLASGGDRLGALLLASDRRDLGNEDWISFGRAVGAQLGQAMRLADAHSHLASSERRYRTLVENARDGIFVLSTSGVILEVNRGGERLLGRDRAAVLGRHFSQFHDPRFAAEQAARFQQVLADGSMSLDDVVLRRPDGRPVIADFSRELVELDGQKVVLSIVHDVTARRAAEAQVRLLHAVALAATEAGDLDGTLESVLRLICRAADLPLAVAWLPDARGGLEPRGWWARAAERHRRLGTDRAPPPGADPPGQAWSRGEPVWDGDLAAAGRPARSALAAELGLRSCLAVPVVVGGERVAVIEAFLEEPSERSEDLVRMISAVAAQIGAVLQRRRAEEALRSSQDQLRQAQKLEAIGRLTGGIAHDFNNVLSVVLSYTSLLLDDARLPAPVRADLGEVRAAGERAAGLTRQLLAFSRRQVLQPEVVDLNEILAGLEKMLRRLLGEDVELITVPSPGPARVVVDPGQMEQVIMNLVVNARDSMPAGGRLTIQIAQAHLDGEPPGLCPYWMLSVEDTGVGMDQATQARIFEPFFTTKEVGRGTGLGLSTVFGIVQQSGGQIAVRSAPGQGATFRVYLPQAAAEQRGASPARGPPEAAAIRGVGTILLVDDDESVRKVLRIILRRQGYEVLEAQGGGDALLVSEQHPGAIHLLLTDMVMPHMSGAQLAARLLAARPGLRVLYMSGHTGGGPANDAPLGPGVAFIQKPFAPEALALRVREVLGAARGGARGPPAGP